MSGSSVGSLVGTGLGGIVGSIVPGIGTGIGMTAGGALGGAAGTGYDVATTKAPEAAKAKSAMVSAAPKSVASKVAMSRLPTAPTLATPGNKQYAMDILKQG